LQNDKHNHNGKEARAMGTTNCVIKKKEKISYDLGRGRENEILDLFTLVFLIVM
jgi:hypothetical protein